MSTRAKVLFFCVLLLSLPVIAQAQTIPTTISAVEFICPQHNDDTGHSLGFFFAGATAPVQTVALGDPAMDRVTLRVRAVVPAAPIQGLGPALYHVFVRAEFPGGTTSPWSAGGDEGLTPVPFEVAARRLGHLTLVP